MKGTIAVLICTLYLVFALAVAEGQAQTVDDPQVDTTRAFAYIYAETIFASFAEGQLVHQSSEEWGLARAQEFLGIILWYTFAGIDMSDVSEGYR